MRRINRDYREALAPVLPDRAGLFAYWGAKDAYGPLQLDRDLVIVDPWADEGESAPALVDALLDQKRRVLVVVNGFPPDLLAEMSEGRAVRGPIRVSVRDGWPPIGLLELEAATP